MSDKHQNRACQKLYAAVINRAVMDACLPPLGKKLKGEDFLGGEPHKVAIDAMRFIFGDSKLFYFYASLIDLPVDRFRIKLMGVMEGEAQPSADLKISDAERRAFLWNYNQYIRRKAAEAVAKKTIEHKKRAAAVIAAAA